MTRSDYKNECGGLVIDFTIDEEPMPAKLFESTQKSFTVKSQPMGVKETRGGYIVKYTIYLADWPRGAVIGDEVADWIFIFIRDPCIDLDIR